MADLVRMSACPKKSESLDLCSSNFFIHLMDLKSVETQITKVVKQRQHTHTLFQQYRLVACGGTERVVTGLKPFFSAFRNYRTANLSCPPLPTPLLIPLLWCLVRYQGKGAKCCCKRVAQYHAAMR